MMLPDAYVIILMKTVFRRPSQMADIFISNILITNDMICLTEVETIATSGEPRAF